MYVDVSDEKRRVCVSGKEKKTVTYADRKVFWKQFVERHVLNIYIACVAVAMLVYVLVPHH